MTGRCTICGGQERSFEFRWQSYAIHRCAACGVEAVEPQPTAPELVEFYQQTSGKKMVGWQRRLGAVQRSFAAYLERYSELTGRPPRRLLDLGGGVGYYTRSAWDCGLEGCLVDWAIDALRFGKETLGLPSVIQGNVQQCGAMFAGGAFDFILARHCIEHLLDPHAFVSQAAALLSPGGILQLETPDITSWEQWSHPRIMAINYGILRRSNPDMSPAVAAGWALRKGMSGVNPPKHLWGFTPSGLSRLVSAHGLKVRGLRRAVAGSRVFDPLYYDREPGSRLSMPAALYRAWERCSSPLFRGRGMNLVLWAERPE